MLLHLDREEGDLFSVFKWPLEILTKAHNTLKSSSGVQNSKDLSVQFQSSPQRSKDNSQPSNLNLQGLLLTFLWLIFHPWIEWGHIWRMLLVALWFSNIRSVHVHKYCTHTYCGSYKIRPQNQFIKEIEILPPHSSSSHTYICRKTHIYTQMALFS